MSDALFDELTHKTIGKRFAALEALPATLDDDHVEAMVRALSSPAVRNRPHQDFLAELYDVLARAKGPAVDEALVHGLLREPRIVYLMMRGHLIGRKGAVHRALGLHAALTQGDAGALPDGAVKDAEARERLTELLTKLDRHQVHEHDWNALGDEGRAAFSWTDDFAAKRK